MTERRAAASVNAPASVARTGTGVVVTTRMYPDACVTGTSAEVQTTNSPSEAAVVLASASPPRMPSPASFSPVTSAPPGETM